MITDHLANHTVDLASLARTSRDINAWATETLYRKTTLGEDPESNAIMYLIRTLLDRPKLAGMILDLSIMVVVHDRGNSSLRHHRFASMPGHAQFDFVEKCAKLIKGSGDQ